MIPLSKSSASALAALLLSFCLVSCTMNAKHGRDFDDSKVSQIVKGKTTAGDIRRMFGKPFIEMPLMQLYDFHCPPKFYGLPNDGIRWVYTYDPTRTKIPSTMKCPVCPELMSDDLKMDFDIASEEPPRYSSPRKGLVVTFDANHVVISYAYHPSDQVKAKAGPAAQR
ncbi:hypothetical protein [Prosthecobacter sp.]|uniref:hypothetical protein n=1 Tax=Prosthecobacter sp. TaxID=1965333 RepID=UPI003784C868